MRRVWMTIALTVVTTSAFAFSPSLRIANIQPTLFRPQGGEQVVITGYGFRLPLRVYFDFGDRTKEAFIVSVTNDQVVAITPAVDLGVGQKREAKLVLVSEAGTLYELRLSPDTVLTYMSEVLRPSVLVTSPQSGPLTGGTRVWIFGEGFQAPVQIFFGDAEAQIVSAVTYGQLAVIAPPGRALGNVPIRINNIGSDTTTTFANGFRYVAPMSFSSIFPTTGSSRGGTDITIRGGGFEEPVFVVVADTAAQVLSVTPTEIRARTGEVALKKCDDRTGDVVVVNIDNGSSVTGSKFTYIGPHPAFTLVPNAFTAGSPSVIQMSDAAAGYERFTLGGRTISFTRSGENGYALEIPRNFTVNCTDVKTTLSYSDIVSGCTQSVPVTVKSAPIAPCNSDFVRREKP